MAEQRIGYFWYNTLLTLTALILLPIIIFRMVVKFRYTLLLIRKITRLPLKQFIWVHAGARDQIAAAGPLLREIAARFDGYQLLATYSGNHDAALNDQTNFELLYIPLPYAVELWASKLISRFKPQLVLLVGECFYPNLIRSCQKAGSKVVLINGRVNRKIAAVHRIAPHFLKLVLGRLDRLLMGSVAEANRIGELGAPLSAIGVIGPEGPQGLGKNGNPEHSETDSTSEAVLSIEALLGGTFETR